MALHEYSVLEQDQSELLMALGHDAEEHGQQHDDPLPRWISEELHTQELVELEQQEKEEEDGDEEEEEDEEQSPFAEQTDD